MKPDYKNWIPKGMMFSLIAGTALSLALLLVFGVFGIGVNGKLRVVLGVVFGIAFVVCAKYTQWCVYAYRSSADASRGAAGDSGAAVSAELRGGRHALCGGGGADPRNVAGAALESWNGVICGRLQRDDGAGCGAGIGAEVPQQCRSASEAHLASNENAGTWRRPLGFLYEDR